MEESVLKNLIAIFKTQARQSFSAQEQQDFRGIYTDPPQSYADKYPDIPKPEPPLSPRLLAARWASHDLRGEDMPSIAADLLEAGYDTPTLRRLAGEMNVTCSADVEELVEKMFRELDIYYPLSEAQAKLFFTQQISREVVAGMRNPWKAASELNRLWGYEIWHHKDLCDVAQLHEELDYISVARGTLPQLTKELVNTYARLGAPTNREKRTISYGLLQGQGWIADDFDAPLPDDLLAQFEGRDEPPV